jgi:hypothetical protein
MPSENSSLTAYGTIRVVVKGDGEVQLDETFLNHEAQISMIGKAFYVNGHHIDVEFCFDPPLKAVLRAV